MPPVANEKMTALCDGGIRMAWTDPQMVTLVANTFGYPARSISGIITEPTDAVSAIEDPDRQPKKVEASTLTSARPPRMNPTNTRARLTKRNARPPSAMIAPASTKNGMASSEKSSTPSEIFNITASSGRSI